MTPSDAVGSSSTSSCGLGQQRARPSATSCFCPRESTRTGRSSGMWSAPDPAQRRRSPRASRRPRRSSSRPSRPSTTLAATSRSSQSPWSCQTTSRPAWRTSRGVAGSGPAVEGDRRRRRDRRPGRGRTTSDDLPAPVSPTRATTSAPSHGQRHVAEHLDGTEPLPDADRLEHSGPRRAAHLLTPPGRTCHSTSVGPPRAADGTRPRRTDRAV